MTSTVGRLVVDVQTNKSGGAVAYGDVVVNDTANAHAFTTTTSAGFTAGVIGVCIEPNGIANNASGRIQFQGYCAQVNAAASVTLGYFLTTHTVAKQATSSATRVVGSFGVALKTSATPDAVLWGFPDASSAAGNVATDPIWDLSGDLVQGTGANTAARLAIVAAGKVLISGSSAAWGFVPKHGCKAYNSATQTINNASFTAFTFDSEEYDSDAFHDTGSATSRITIPTGMGGLYTLQAGTFANNANWSWIGFRLGGTTNLRGFQRGAIASYTSLSITQELAAGDYVEVGVATSASVIFGHASAVDAQTWFSATLNGA